jgi:peptide/nickel transport system substrate-binding protein
LATPSATFSIRGCRHDQNRSLGAHWPDLRRAGSAQTLTLMKGIDAPHYDGQRTTWGPTSDIVNMFQDTLVALDWDGRTPIPYLAKSWDISEDGKTYTFKLRDDVTFCSGKKFTAEDVIYSFKRLKDPAIKGPYAWRAGTSRNCARPIPTRCSTSSRSPISELLLQLTMFTNAIHNKDSVEALGKDYGIKAHRRHRALVLRQLAAAHRNRAEAPRRLQMGPVDVQEQGPGEIRKAGHQDRAGGFQPRGGDDGRAVRHHPPVPGAVHQPGQGRADADVTAGQAELPAALFRLQDHAADGGRPRVREAMSIAINRAEIAKGILLGNAEPAFTVVDKDALDSRSETGHRQGRHRTRQEAARRSRLEGRGRRRARKGRLKLQPKVYYTRPQRNSARRRGDPGLSAQASASTGSSTLGLHHRAVKMAEQDYEIWSVTVPYLSAGDLMNIYFDSATSRRPTG